ncbi:MAG: DUF1013 domain-containing protein [Hyphomicrobiales bacterium]|nr:DUF1013 domain-containing protein [Hyphomicrobiales bacterium]
MTLPLMPKATAVWLVENTALTFDQIAQFCGMHPLEVQGIADGEVAVGIIGQDPITSGLLAKENLEAAEKDASVKLKLRESVQEYIITQQKQKKRYTPVARRQDKPDAVAWLIKHHPELTDAQIVKLVGTTKSTIAGIRDRSHWNMQNIRPRDPVLLGLCQQTELQMAVDKALAAKERGEKKVTKAQKAEAKNQKEAPDAAASA